MYNQITKLYKQNVCKFISIIYEIHRYIILLIKIKTTIYVHNFKDHNIKIFFNK